MFDLNSPIWDEESGEVDDERLAEYIEQLLGEFAESPEAKEFAEAYDTEVGWADMYMDYAARYLGQTPATMTDGDTEEIVFEIFPQKVSVESEFAGEIVAELRAFWQFLKRTRSLEQADDMLALLTEEDAEELESLLADPGNFGMAKSFYMTGKASGYDMTTEEGVAAFAQVYNAGIRAARGSQGFEELDEDEPDESFFSVAPIWADSPRVGRNDPCPCGSGRKYKKCCGAK
jgi:hypothetical protein